MPIQIVVHRTLAAGLLLRRNRRKTRAALAIICLWALSVPPALGASESTPVPALSRPLNRGDIIQESDLETIEIKGANANQIYITDDSTLIGMSLKRSIRAGVPLRDSDITEPKIITKGDMVTMAFEAPGLLLTTRGKALDDGAQGAIVRVMNTQTSRTVEAAATAPGYVLVSMPAGAPPISTPDAKH